MTRTQLIDQAIRCEDKARDAARRAELLRNEARHAGKAFASSLAESAQAWAETAQSELRAADGLWNAAVSA